MDHSIYIYGMKFPNRIFVGGLVKSAEAKDLAVFFEDFGSVTEAKIILNGQGLSKGYGFVTFEKPEDVENVMRQGKLYFCGKKLNLGPAVRKQAPDVAGEPVVVITNQTSKATPASCPPEAPPSPPVQPQEYLPANAARDYLYPSQTVYYRQPYQYPSYIPYYTSNTSVPCNVSYYN